MPADVKKLKRDIKNLKKKVARFQDKKKVAGWGVRWQLMKKNPGTEFFFLMIFFDLFG